MLAGKCTNVSNLARFFAFCSKINLGMPMKCLKCAYSNRDECKFCVRCGTELFLTCEKCGNSNSLKSKFCDKCGNPSSICSQRIETNCVDNSTNSFNKYDDEEFKKYNIPNNTKSKYSGFSRAFSIILIGILALIFSAVFIYPREALN